jgi:hypothetical protein
MWVQDREIMKLKGFFKIFEMGVGNLKVKTVFQLKNERLKITWPCAAGR